MDEITINGIEYIRKDSVQSLTPEQNGMRYCMVRTYSAGVFAGYVKERRGSEIDLVNARRIWSWSGAASLSELATRGTSKPNDCKFPCEVEEVTLFGVIEIIPITAKAKASIDEVPVWTK